VSIGTSPVFLREAEWEAALRQASAKFERRFRGIEQRLRERAVAIENCTLEQLDVLWAEVKQLEKSAAD